MRLRPQDPGAAGRLALAVAAVARTLDGPAAGHRPGGSEHRRPVSLHRALGILAPRQRAVIVRRHHEDLPEAESAKALSIAVGAVKSQARHALRRWRDKLPELADVFVSPWRRPLPR